MSRGDNVQGILGAIGPFCAKWGPGRVSRSPSFFCVVVQRTFRQLQNGRFLPNLVTKRSSVFRRGIHEDIFETFHFRGHLPQKSEIENRSNKHLTQSRLQVTECPTERYCLLHVVAQGPGVSEISSTFLYNVPLRQSFPIFGFWPIFPIQNLKTYLPVTSLQPRGYIAE